jgi:hypothetical protein
MTKTMSRAIILTGIMQIFLMSSLAQSSCGPQPEGGCNECGPYPTPWTLDYCPSQTNSSSVSPTTLCNKVGDAPTVPTVVVPIYQDGLKETYTTYDCANTTYQYAGISYTASAVLWDPPLPGTFTSANVPSFSSQAYVNVTSSDTNLCPSPGRVNIGSCTWAISPGTLIISSTQYNWTPDWAAMLANLGGSVISSPVTFSPISGSDENYYHSFCCGNTPAIVTFDYDSINASSQQFNVTVGSGSIEAIVDTIINNGSDTICGILGVSQLSSAASQAAEAVVDPNLQVDFSAAAGSLKATGAANINNVVGYNDSCVCSSPNVWFGSDNVSFGCTIGSLNVPSNIFQQIGVTNFPPISIVALSASLNYTKNSYSTYVGPDTTTYSVTENDRQVSNIYTDIEIGTLYSNKHYWSGPRNDLNTSTTSICEGHDYP